jgi:hypothetical protein
VSLIAPSFIEFGQTTCGLPPPKGIPQVAASFK